MRYERMQNYNWRICTPPYGPLCLNMKKISRTHVQLWVFFINNHAKLPRETPNRVHFHSLRTFRLRIKFLTQRTYFLRRRCTHAHLLLQNRTCNVSLVYQLRRHLRRHHVRRWRCVFAIHAPHVWYACHSCLASNRRPNRNRSNVTTAPTYPNYSSSCETGAN